MRPLKMLSCRRLTLISAVTCLLLSTTTTKTHALVQRGRDDRLKTIDVYSDDTVQRSKRDVNEEEVAGNEDDEQDLFKVSDLSSAFHLNNSHLHLMVHWAGQGSSLMFCLARDQTLDANATSRVFVSRDYGTTFEDISAKFVLESGNLALINKFHSHPNRGCHYVFTDVTHQHIFFSEDCGQTFTTRRLELTPDEIVFNVNDDATFLVHDVTDLDRRLYVTHDFGLTFSHVQDYVQTFFLTSKGRLFVQRLQPSESNDTRSAILMSDRFFERQVDSHVVFNGADELEVRNDVVFVTRRSNDDERDIELHISLDGTKFVMATFASYRPIHRDYYIVDVTDDQQVLLAINHNSVLSNLYVSTYLNRYQAEFVPSLERVLFYNPKVTFKHSWLADTSNNEPFVDVHKVEGLRGIYIANQIIKEASNDTILPSDLRSLITYDMGAMWHPMEGPSTDEQGRPYDRCAHGDKSKKCSMHLSQQLSRKYPMQRSVPILSSKSALGIIIGSGNMGEGLSEKNNVFLSADAGLSWHQVLKGAYIYNLGDHGGVIVAVKYFKTQGWTNVLMYSIDEGRTWDQIVFYKEPLRVYGLLTEPGENTTVFTLFGSTDSARGVDWIIVKVDLRSVFSRNCSQGDYRQWSPSDSSSTNKHRGCLLGRKEIYERRVVDAKCYNGRDYERVVSVANCMCEREDYFCDFAFDKDPETNSCIKIPRFNYDPYAPPFDCEEGKFFLRTRGYVKIPGDSCQGGKASWFEPQSTPCPVSVEKEFMLVSQRHSIARIDLANFDKGPEELPVGNLNNVITLEFDTKRNCLIYGDIEVDRIFVQCLNGSEKRVVVDSGLRSVEGMSYDWTTQSLFFVDGTKPSVEVVSLRDLENEDHEKDADEANEGPKERKKKKHFRKTILNERYVKKPRGLAVHPMEGFLFFSDWSDHNPHIGRCNMDGSDVIKVVTKPNVIWPNGITIDFTSNRLFWVDAQKDFIASSDLDGKGFKKILTGIPALTHPFAIAVHKDLMYWDDWNKKAIFYADKNHGEGLKLLQAHLNGAMDLKIYSNIHRSGTSACEQDQELCSHLCLPMPQPTNYTCLCPDGLKPSSERDGRNECVCPDNSPPSSHGTCEIRDDGSCYPSQYKCKNNKECIPQQWRCDGEGDCLDGSDEENCHEEECESHQFTCDNGKCIPGYWKCDFDDDCGDNSDEKDCQSADCDDDHFRCTNGQCISIKWRCDLEKDCQDGSDELNCTSITEECKEDQFKCSGFGQCLPDTWKCDGDRDCPNGEDEEDCPSFSCKIWQFRCDSGQCIFKTWVCDGQKDCQDGSDERNCTILNDHKTPETPELPEAVFPKGECHEWMYKCKNEQCIPFWWKCDGTEDCSDGSDELECQETSTSVADVNVDNRRNHQSANCPSNKFACDDGECIWQSWVCDNEQDCSGGEDENEDLCRNEHICSHNEFRCEYSAQCVDYKEVCDGKEQCDDGSDEHGCDNIEKTESEAIQCDDDHFLCDTNKCRPNLEWCDGKNDCMDNTDEFNCYDKGYNDVVGLIKRIDVVELTATSVKIKWSLHETHLSVGDKEKKMLFRPRLAIEDTEGLWVKPRDWLPSSNKSYNFDQLHPYTHYNLTVDIKEGQTVLEGSKFISVTTAEAEPDPPSIAEVKLLSETKVRVTWTKSGRPNGKIVGYDIKMNNKVFNVKDPNTNTTIINFDFRHGQDNVDYVFKIRAVNEIFKGQFSQPVTLASSPSIFSASVVNLSLTDIKDTSATLRFSPSRPSDLVKGFVVRYNSENRFASYPPINISKDSSPHEYEEKFTHLSPNTTYYYTVYPVDDKGLRGEKAVRSFRTTGSTLPTPHIRRAKVSADKGTSVTLTWDLNGDDRHKSAYVYGVYYGGNMVDLLANGVRVRVEEGLSTVVPNLHACRSYVFVLAIVEPFFSSPSKPVSLITNYAPGAPVKRLEASLTNDTVLHITWEASCVDLNSNIGYIVTMVDLINSKVSDDVTHLAATKDYYHSLNKQLPYGSKYRVEVKTDDPNAQSASIVADGPPLPRPVHLTHHWLDFEEKRTHFVHWQSSDWIPLEEREVLYAVRFSKNHNMSDSKVFKVKEKPIFAIDEAHLTVGEQYYVSVQLQDKNGYSSLQSDPILVQITANNVANESLKEERSDGNGFVALSLFFLLLLAGGIVGGVVYMRRHQRFSRRFKEFRSRYSPAAGSAAILNQNDIDEDEDDTPIIRGFSDNEPLVVA